MANFTQCEIYSCHLSVMQSLWQHRKSINNVEKRQKLTNFIRRIEDIKRYRVRRRSANTTFRGRVLLYINHAYWLSWRFFVGNIVFFSSSYSPSRILNFQAFSQKDQVKKLLYRWWCSLFFIWSSKHYNFL